MVVARHIINDVLVRARYAYAPRMHWYYANDFTEWPICELFGGYCFDMIMSDNTYYKQCIGQCMRDCEETAFMVVPSSFPLDVDKLCYYKRFLVQHFEKNFNKHFAFKRYQILVDDSGSISDLLTSFTNGSLCKDYARNYVSFVRVESPISKILFTKKDRRIYFYDQLGTFGGTFGLFMGVSVISMFQVFAFTRTDRIEIYKNERKKERNDRENLT